MREEKCTDEPYTSFTDRIAQILLGSATSDVVRLAGPPTTQTSTNDVQTWIYEWAAMKPGFWSVEGSATMCFVTISNSVVANKEVHTNVCWRAIE